MARRLDAAPAAAVGIALCAIAFLTTAGAEGGLGPNTWTEIVLVLAGAGVAIWMLARGGARPGVGGAAVLLFGAIALLTALSIAWSVEPDQSWIEAGRTLAYFATFAAAANVARVLPARWPAAAGGIAIAAAALAAWAVLVKALTLSTQMQPEYGRLLTPFDYWNATGLIAAMGLAPALWAASRREGTRIVQALAVPAIALLITVVVLSYSRSAALAGIVGTAVPFAFGATRLRSALMLAIAAAGAGVMCGWALSDAALTGDASGYGGSVSHAARVSAGHEFGLIGLVVLLALAAAGYLVRGRADRAELSPERRRRIGTVLVGLLALVPVGGVLALLVSRRGLTGEISHLWHRLTSTSGKVGNSAARFLNASNSRPAYWRQGLSVGDHHLLAGAGAGSFGVAHLPYQTNALIRPVPQAHSYLIETYADFGLIGVLLNVALLVAFLLAAWRALRAAEASERGGLAALLGVVVAFGASSAIDWTWFVPGVALPAMLCAGWLVGRDPRGERAATAAPRPLLSRPLAVGGVTAIAVAALALVYAVWQPLRSAQVDNAAISADAAGSYGTALTDARAAVADFPVSLAAIEELAAIEGRSAAAQAELVHATSVQPQNPYAWVALGQYELSAQEYRLAFEAFVRARALYWGGYRVLDLDCEAAAARTGASAATC